MGSVEAKQLCRYGNGEATPLGQRRICSKHGLVCCCRGNVASIDDKSAAVGCQDGCKEAATYAAGTRVHDALA